MSAEKVCVPCNPNNWLACGVASVVTLLVPAFAVAVSMSILHSSIRESLASDLNVSNYWDDIYNENLLACEEISSSPVGSVVLGLGFGATLSFYLSLQLVSQFSAVRRALISSRVTHHPLTFTSFVALIAVFLAAESSAAFCQLVVPVMSVLYMNCVSAHSENWAVVMEKMTENASSAANPLALDLNWCIAILAFQGVVSGCVSASSVAIQARWASNDRRRRVNLLGAPGVVPPELALVRGRSGINEEQAPGYGTAGH
jgi:MFS family permease